MRRVRWFGFLVVCVLLLVACAGLQSGVPEVEVAEVAAANAGEDGQVRLMAGHHLEVGVVSMTNDAEEVCVTYALNEGALADGWLLYETHLFVGADVDFPLTRPNARLGGPYFANPIPGHFPFGDDDLAGVEESTHCVGLDDLGVELGEEVFVAAHAAIGGVGRETAWGEGSRFNQLGNWGMWFTYTLALDLYELTIEVIGSGTATGAGMYAAGTAVPIEAIADPSNIFQFWSAPAGDFVDEFAVSTTFTMPAEDVTVTARFMPEGELEERDYGEDDLCTVIQGGKGILVDTWDIGALADGAALDFYFHAWTAPDRWTVSYAGSVVFSSGWVSTNPSLYDGHPSFPEGVRHHYWHPNVESSDWEVFTGPYPNGGLYVGIVTKHADHDDVAIRTEGAETGTVWKYKLCPQP